MLCLSKSTNNVQESLPLDDQKSFVILPADPIADWTRLNFLTNRVSVFAVEAQSPNAALKRLFQVYTLEHPESACVAYVIATKEEKPTITMSITNQPLGHILQLIANISRYRISLLNEKSVLLFEDRDFRDIQVRFAFVSETLLHNMGVHDFGRRQETDAWFKSRGVKMPTGATALYIPETGSLLLQNEPRELEIMDAILTLAQRGVDTRQIGPMGSR